MSQNNVYETQYIGQVAIKIRLADNVVIWQCESNRYCTMRAVLRQKAPMAAMFRPSFYRARFQILWGRFHIHPRYCTFEFNQCSAFFATSQRNKLAAFQRFSIDKTVLVLMRD